jgi:hypothetical protein
MPKIFRGMLPDGAKPMLGSDGKMLGIRIPVDIRPDANGNVFPRSGGMSVSPTLRQLPPHRIPRRLRAVGVSDAEGTDKLNVWSMGSGPFVEGPVRAGLTLRLDPNDPTHGLVEPDRVMSVNDYRIAIEATRDDWVIEEVVT